MKTNNNRRKKEMAPFIGAIRLALSVILLGGTGAFAQTLTTLRDFGSNTDGQNPQAGVVFDQRGHLYGTAALGGVDGNGIVYRLTPPEGTGGPWRGSVLHKFAGQPDGAVPVSSLTISPSGDLFGTTEEGGAHNKGTVFGLQPPQNPGDPWRERVFYSFGSSATDGVVPNSELLPANPGFYGVTREGAPKALERFFWWRLNLVVELTGAKQSFTALPAQVMPRFLRADWSRTRREIFMESLWWGAPMISARYTNSPHQPPKEELGQRLSYSRSADPMEPCPLADCNLMKLALIYGTTTSGGSGQAGTVFKLLLQSQPGVSWNESVLYNFSGGRDGGSPFGGSRHRQQGHTFWYGLNRRRRPSFARRA